MTPIERTAAGAYRLARPTPAWPGPRDRRRIHPDDAEDYLTGDVDPGERDEP